MSDTVQIHPYEILVRFGCEIGDRAGAVRGIAAQQRAVLVDDAGIITGKIDRGGADNPQTFPQDQLVSLLGDAIVATDAAHADEITKINAEHDIAMAAVAGELQQTRAALALVSSESEAAQSAIVARDQSIAALTAQIAELTTPQPAP